MMQKRRIDLDNVARKVESLYEYLYRIDVDKAMDFAKTGNWPTNIQIPKSSAYLNGDWKIDWNQAPQGGYVLDASGNPIKNPYVPKPREILDRHGPQSGRYTSPVVDGKPYDYSQRSLPYVENPEMYHQYEVIGDFNDIESYVKNCSDLSIKAKVEDLVNIHYGRL